MPPRGRGRGRGVPLNPPATIEQLLAVQTQLMEALVNNQQNHPIGGAPPRDKRGEFLKGHPPVFTHATDPLEADDWLRAVEKQLNIAQCDDRQKVLFASGQLQGEAQTWWESFEYGRPPNAPAITWLEFKENFRSYHIPEGLIELKAEEFRNLKQGSMTVPEYRDKFAQLSRYAPSEVANDADKQRLFLKGLYDGLQLQLMSNEYPNYQTLVNRAIVVDNKRKEMDAKRKRMQGQASGSNTRPRTNQQQGSQRRYQGPPSQWNRGQYPQRNQFQQRPQYQQNQQQGNQQTSRQGTPGNTPMKTSAPNTPNKCFRCGKEGHLSYHCPEKQNQQTP